MHDPDVALSDLVLAIEAAWLGRRIPVGSSLAGDGRALFWAVAAGAGAGGAMHGFFPKDASVGHRLLWPLALLSAGWATAAALRVGLRLHGAGGSRGMAIVSGAPLALGALAVVRGQRQFARAVDHAAPAGLLLGAAFARRAIAGERRVGAAGLTAVGLGGAAALIHRRRLALRPLAPDAWAHIAQGAALAALAIALRNQAA
jgi:hypothetical protein